MSERIKKKLRKRSGFKKYANYRWHLIMQRVRDMPAMENCDMLYLVTSRNNKRIRNIYGLKNTHPVGTSCDNGVKSDGAHYINLNIDFKASMRDALHGINGELLTMDSSEKTESTYAKLLESWKEWLEANLYSDKEEKPYHTEADRADAYRYAFSQLDELKKITGDYNSAIQEMVEKTEDLLKNPLESHPLVPITAADIADATEPCERYDMVMPRDIDTMREKIQTIQSRDCVILSVFPGIVDDLEGIVETYRMDATGINTVEIDDGRRQGNINLELLLDRLLEATEDNTRFILLPWCPGIRITLSTLKIRYAFIRPDQHSRHEFFTVAKETAELNGHPIESGSFTEFCLELVDCHWDAFFTDKIMEYENLVLDVNGDVPVSPTIIYKPHHGLSTGLYQLEDAILKAFDREWPLK